MPWKEQRALGIRLEFVMDVLRGEATKATSSARRRKRVSAPSPDGRGLG